MPEIASPHKQPANGRHREGEGARQVGKYLVSPLIRLLDNGWFATSVSIRSGSGSATTDRVLRLTRVFRCAAEAADCAHREAVRWIGDACAPPCACPN